MDEPQFKRIALMLVRFVKGSNSSEVNLEAQALEKMRKRMSNG